VSLPIPSPDNPEEIEIDRLLRELGIELPAIESIADYTRAADDNSEVPSNADEAADLPDEAETIKLLVTSAAGPDDALTGGDGSLTYS